MTAEPAPDKNRIGELAQLIRELGYRGEKYSDVSASTTMSGYTTLVFHFTGYSLQMYTGFNQQEEKPFTLEDANNFNVTNRFVKCYLSNDSNPKGVRFEYDFLFDIGSETALEDLRRIFQMWELALGSIRTTFFAKWSS